MGRVVREDSQVRGSQRSDPEEIRKTVSDSFDLFDPRTALAILVRMETDSFFCQLLKHLPQTVFELLGLPAKQAGGYRFDSVEVKKSFRIDGLFNWWRSC